MKTSIVTIALIFSFFASNIQYFNTFALTYTPAEYPESTAYLDNPHIGYYHLYGYILKDEIAYASPADVPNVPKPEEDGNGERLVLIQINLCRFKDRELTETALSQLDTILSAWCGTDYSLLLRFIYDWDGAALSAEPQDISLILRHMEQTASVYNQYADHILTLQGLFTGNHGEMNHTNYGSSADMQLLASKLAETAAPSIYLAVRTPDQWRSITGTEDPSDLASLPESPYLGRLGLYNDGMLGSETDTGTYTDRSRWEELSFQDILCRTVPNGGEVIIDNPFNDLDSAVADLRQMHVSYLNSTYDSAVLDKWKQTVYSGDDIFNGVSGYEYIRDHLGYRFVLRSTELVYDYIKGQVSLRIGIENTGFSGSYRGYSFCLTLLDISTGGTIPVSAAEDSSYLASGEITCLDLPLAAGDYPESSYELYWQTTDESSGEAILYGNDLTLTEHGYLLGTLLIEKP